MKLSFTTLACPEWDVDTIVRAAADYGFQGVDFRGTKEGLDISVQAAFTKDLSRTKALIDAEGLKVSGISSSMRICDTEAFAKNLEEARRTIPIALELGAEQIRVFGYGNPARERIVSVDQGKRCLDAVLAIEGASRINWLLEMHDYWISSDSCLQLVSAVSHERFRILWDVGHTTRVGGESVASTIEALDDWISCVHVKDAIYDPSHPNAMKDGWRYVLPGEGQLPLEQSVRALEEIGYQGWFVFEHEKRWHRKLEGPEIALPAYVRWMTQTS